MTEWWNFFADSNAIDFIHTSGEQTRANLPFIRGEEYELIWHFMSKLTGKKIIDDSGIYMGKH